MDNTSQEKVAESAAVSAGDKRAPSVGSTPHSSNNSAPRSSSSVSSSSGQDKYFYRDKLVFDPDVYINNPSYSDFQFKVGSSEIGLSGIVLAANSSFIHFKIHSENCKRLDVSTLELDVEQVKEMVRPLYNGRLSLNSRNLLSFLMFSTLFEFQWIFDCCLVYFTEHINPELVFDFLELGLRSQNHCMDSYRVVMKLCSKYLEEGHNMQLTCAHIKGVLVRIRSVRKKMHAVALQPTQIVSLQECNKMKKLSRDLVEFLCSVNTHNSIDVLSLVLFWLRLDTKNMEVVPTLLDSFDFADVFKQNQELAESFFTHIISGDFTAEVRMRIMNLSFQSCKNTRSSKNRAGFRMSRLKSVKDIKAKDQTEHVD
ncbi:uncharacterized protein LOC134824089 isoform X1 [Bolinopsis microptera]|uniref:uncharacterized protein LOC134824089 isoform X1 n=1 Tax=Bolinopsis microptera TaxID=2820187 RepID=UPI0030791919